MFVKIPLFICIMATAPPSKYDILTLRATLSELADAKLVCGACKQVMTKPCEMPCCGARFCVACVCESNGKQHNLRALPGKEHPFCSACNETYETTTPMYVLLSVQAQINQMVVECTLCRASIIWAERDAHMASECSKACETCKVKLVGVDTINSHVCPEELVPCTVPYCDKRVPRKDSNAHVADADHTLARLQEKVEKLCLQMRSRPRVHTITAEIYAPSVVNMLDAEQKYLFYKNWDAAAEGFDLDRPITYTVTAACAQLFLADTKTPFRHEGVNSVFVETTCSLAPPATDTSKQASFQLYITAYTCRHKSSYFCVAPGPKYERKHLNRACDQPSGDEKYAIGITVNVLCLQYDN